MSAHSTTRLTFYGAAGTVTGSKYLLETAEQKILVDCGLFQGRKELRLMNWAEPPFDPRALDAIVLTHAHIDHTGYLPLVVKCGYRGPIYCTAATAALLALMLPDSAHLQEEEAAYANLKGTSKHSPALPLYNAHDVQETLGLLRIMESRSPNQLFSRVTVTPWPAGHILGAVILNFDLGGKRITFSGDIGRYDCPILPDPSAVDFGDVLLCESTYGNRLHADFDAAAELQRVIKRAAERGGPLIIPAFAVGRTQQLLYYIAELEQAGKIPVLPVYVDSPMAVDATRIYREFHHDYDDEMRARLRSGEKPLATARTTFCKTVKESKALNGLRGPRIIISASGMVTGGRILHHLSNWLEHPEATVLFCGYQAEGTRGRTIESGSRDVKIFGRRVPINAHIESISSLSAHADRDELLRWLTSCGGRPTTVKIVHGEAEASRALAHCLERKMGWNATVAAYAETLEF